MTIVPDDQSAIDFLQWLRPRGPWVLTAIPQDGGNTTTETFGGHDLKRLAAWIHEFNGKQNLYFMVNPARGPLRSKAAKDDVEGLAFLHVDVDPAKGVDPAKDRPKILERLQAFTPPPSAIIDSGGGYQGFWRLDDTLYTGGDSGRIADAEAYNQQLEIVLGGDHCFNCDRIMRLPGTVNLPNEKKRKAGRVPRLAALVSSDASEHGLGEFTAAPKVQDTVAGAPQVKLSGNLAPVLIDDLPNAVSQRIRMLIVQGEDPDEPLRYGSRSEASWAVVCGLVRGGCTDDQIASILLDPDYAISGHTLSQKRSVEYAARQIQRAREECDDPMLRMLNDKHAVIADLGGKCRIISEVMDNSLKHPRLRISKQSFEDFRNRYMHVKVQVAVTKEGAPIYGPAGKWWLSHPMRRQYTSLIFAPNREVEDAYNLWQGFSCEAIPGDKHLPFLKHIHDNICSGDETHYEYTVRWMARAVQEPGMAGEVAIVLRGGMGTGKGTFISIFGSLWGRHFMHISSAKHLVGQFNAHLRDCVVLFADEAFFAGDKQHEGVLRALITEDSFMVEGKGLDAEIAPNYTHLLMGSNSHWVVPAGMDERRFFVMEVGEEEKQNVSYFAKVRKAMNSGGRESLLHYLLNLDISDFNVRDVPQTAALQEQKLFSLTAEESWWLERLMDGRTVASMQGWETSLLKERLQNDYLRYADQQRIMRRASPTVLGRFLGRVMPGDFPQSVQRTADVEKVDSNGHVYSTRERAYFYDLPTLQECRDLWTERYGSYDWPKEEASEAPANRVKEDDPY